MCGSRLSLGYWLILRQPLALLVGEAGLVQELLSGGGVAFHGAVEQGGASKAAGVILGSSIEPAQLARQPLCNDQSPGAALAWLSAAGLLLPAVLHVIDCRLG